MGSFISRQAPSMQIALQNIQGVKEKMKSGEKIEQIEKLEKIELDITEYTELFKEMR